MNIRPTVSQDIVALQRVVDATKLFPSEMLPDMVSDFLSGLDRKGLWFTCEADGKAVGFCYAAPEDLADGAWNMLAIAVLPTEQGNGYGRAIVNQLEAHLKALDQRILIVDTSGSDEFSRTREFYRNIGYAEEARIRDFWGTGDDKVVFWKSLR